MTEKIGFIGIGNMGLPMIANLRKGGFHIRGFDLDANACAKAQETGAEISPSLEELALGCSFIITALPEDEQVAQCYRKPNGVFATAKPGAICIDCSTISIPTTRKLHDLAEENGFGFVDAPMSGGIHGAKAASLTFMIGGSEANFNKAKAVLRLMGKNMIHTGGAGCGQAAKICNNMLLGISMIGVCEAFGLAAKLGLEASKLYEVSAHSSGRCWALENCCPAPGVVAQSPANQGYQPGFKASLMLKDLKLAQNAALQYHAATPLGASACALYTLLEKQGLGEKDFSAIMSLIGENKKSV